MSELIKDMIAFLVEPPSSDAAPAAPEAEAIPGFGGLPPEMAPAAPSSAAEATVPDMSALLLGEPRAGPRPEEPRPEKRDAALLAPSAALGGAFALPEGGASVEAQATVARLGFRVGNLRLMVPLDGGSELSEMVPIYRLPNTASWFRGLANLHGNLVPAFDLAARAQAARTEKAQSLLLVLGHGAAAAAVIVDGPPQRLRLEAADKVDPPALPEAIRDYVPGAYLQGNEVWLEFDHGRYFSAQATAVAA